MINCSPGKRVSGSNALASQLYKNVNHNSSSRSSNGDNEDFCSDASLEDDVVDLGHKVLHHRFYYYYFFKKLLTQCLGIL